MRQPAVARAQVEDLQWARRPGFQRLQETVDEGVEAAGADAPILAVASAQVPVGERLVILRVRRAAALRLAHRLILAHELLVIGFALGEQEAPDALLAREAQPLSRTAQLAGAA